MGIATRIQITTSSLGSGSVFATVYGDSLAPSGLSPGGTVTIKLTPQSGQSPPSSQPLPFSETPTSGTPEFTATFSLSDSISLGLWRIDAVYSGDSDYAPSSTNVSSQSIITTVVGGAVTTLQLTAPTSIAFGPDNTLWIADGKSIFKVLFDATLQTATPQNQPVYSVGTITTDPAYIDTCETIAVDPTNGKNVYARGNGVRRIIRIIPSSIDSHVGVLVADNINSPVAGGLGGLAVNQSSQIFADGFVSPGGVLFKVSVNSSGSAQTTMIVGSDAAAGFSADPNTTLSGSFFNQRPHHIACDRLGTLYVAEALDKCIFIISTNNPTHTWKWGPSLPLATPDPPHPPIQHGIPAGVAVDSSFNVFYSDLFKSYIYKAIPSAPPSPFPPMPNYAIVNICGGPIVSQDNVPAIQSGLQAPLGLAVNALDDLFIVDNTAKVIRKIASGAAMMLLQSNTTITSFGPNTVFYHSGALLSGNVIATRGGAITEGQVQLTFTNASSNLFGPYLATFSGSDYRLNCPNDLDVGTYAATIRYTDDGGLKYIGSKLIPVPTFTVQPPTKALSGMRLQLRENGDGSFSGPLGQNAAYYDAEQKWGNSVLTITLTLFHSPFGFVDGKLQILDINGHPLSPVANNFSVTGQNSIPGESVQIVTVKFGAAATAGSIRNVLSGLHYDGIAQKTGEIIEVTYSITNGIGTTYLDP